MKVLITGAAGMLGTDLAKVFAPEHDLVLCDITGGVDLVDITRTDQVMQVVGDHKPDLVVHAAAFANVDGCETDPDRAYRVNAFGTWNIASACRRFDAAVAYVSTDYVFDGEKGAPYTEYDAVNPLGHYGASKLAGEKHVRELCSRHYIVRTAWLYGENGKNFPYTILKAAKAGKPLRVIADQTGSPTFTVDLAQAIREITGSPLFGTYHVTNKGGCSWHEFAVKILALAGMDGVAVEPISSDEWQSPTRRPKHSILRHYALEMQGRDNLRSWEDALADFVLRVSV